MPMHDWTRVEPNDYHTFHLLWLASLATALNNGVLPDGYFAMAEHTSPPIVPDVITLTTPDADAAPVAVRTAPRARIVDREAGRAQKVGGRRRVAIRHARDRRIVAVIEIVSPSNKRKAPEFADLVWKSAQLLRQGVHLILIDPFPPGRRDPHGLHAAVWRHLTGKAVTPPADQPLTAAAYAALGGNQFEAYVEPLAVGDPLPELPLFLTSTAHVPAPLKATYQAAWAGFPAPLRELVAGR
ncbi:MAG: DUF4058 family protein [Gemmataceae bacterium]|nr:DUF4058 family protein [Gemmataceae bacterium]